MLPSIHVSSGLFKAFSCLGAALFHNLLSFDRCYAEFTLEFLSKTKNCSCGVSFVLFWELLGHIHNPADVVEVDDDQHVACHYQKYVCPLITLQLCKSDQLYKEANCIANPTH